jgi:hypothetical protein
MLYENIKTKIFKIIILLVFYGHGTQSLTLSEVHRLRAFENRVLWGILGLKRMK